MLKAAWAENQVWTFATARLRSGAATGSVWSAAASFRHVWAPNLRSDVTWGYFSQSGTTVGAANGYDVKGDLVWSPVTGFFAGVQGMYAKISTASGTWGVKVRLERDW